MVDSEIEMGGGGEGSERERERKPCKNQSHARAAILYFEMSHEKRSFKYFCWNLQSEYISFYQMVVILI